MSFLNTLFGTPPPRKATAAQGPVRDNPMTIAEGSENATRRQLVQVMLRDVVRKNGIPPGWIECQMLVVASSSRGNGMFVRLIMKHWEPRMVNYAPAFQHALFSEIRKFEPASVQWLHGISWEFDVEDSYPFKSLPEKAYWQDEPVKLVRQPVSQPIAIAPVAPAIAGMQVEENEASADLEKLFAIRDNELERMAAEGLTPVGYEKTQPSPL